VNSATEIGSVTIADAKVTFYSRTSYSLTSNRETEIGMSETGSAYAKRTIVGPLLAQGLTTQEIYLALAGPGAVAPPELVASQAQEAALLRRSADLRHVTVDTSTLVEKSLTSCENAIIGSSAPYSPEYAWALYHGNTQGGIGASDYPGYGSCSTDYAIIGICNEGSNSGYYYAMEYYGSSSCNNYAYQIAAGTLPVGYYYYYYWQNTGGADYEIQNELSTTNSYDLVTGYLVYVGG
jgi:hypothetical protein